MKITYYPVFEFTTFGLVLLILTGAFIKTDINAWIICLVAIPLYLITLGGSQIIILNEEKLTVVSLNPFYKSHKIDLSSFNKITSIEINSYKSDTTSKASYNEFKRKYSVEYRTSNGKINNAIFSINSIKKEKMLIENLKKYKRQ